MNSKLNNKNKKHLHTSLWTHLHEFQVMLALFLGLFLSTFSMLFLHFLKAFPVNKHFSCQASGSGWSLLCCFLGLQRPSAALTHTLLRHLPNRNYTHCRDTCFTDIIHTAEIPDPHTHCWDTFPTEIIHTAEIPTQQKLYTLLRHTHCWDTCPTEIIHTAAIPAQH